MVYSTHVKLVFPRNDYLRDHTFMMSTHKGDGGSWNLPRVYGFYCLQTIDLSFILVEVEGWGSQNCGCHMCMTPNPELINCYVNFWSEIR